MTVEPLMGGQANTVFAVTFSSNQRVILRLHSRTDGFAGTVRTIETLKVLGLPVPEVIAHGHRPDIDASWHRLWLCPPWHTWYPRHLAGALGDPSAPHRGPS